MTGREKRAALEKETVERMLNTSDASRNYAQAVVSEIADKLEEDGLFPDDEPEPSARFANQATGRIEGGRRTEVVQGDGFTFTAERKHAEEKPDFAPSKLWQTDEAFHDEAVEAVRRVTFQRSGILPDVGSAATTVENALEGMSAGFGNETVGFLFQLAGKYEREADRSEERRKVEYQASSFGKVDALTRSLMADGVDEETAAEAAQEKVEVDEENARRPPGGVLRDSVDGKIENLRAEGKRRQAQIRFRVSAGLPV